MHVFMAVLRGMMPLSIPSTPLTAAEKMLLDFDIKAFLSAFGEATPSLEEAVLQIVGPRGHGCKTAVLGQTALRVSELLGNHSHSQDCL